MTAHTNDFQKELFEEMKSRIKEDDQSVPYLYNGYYYITRFETGSDYPIYSRKKGSLSAKEEIMFNCNELAKGHNYFKLGGLSVSSNNQYVAFAVDTVGRRIYSIQIKNLITGELFNVKIENTTGDSTWANDNLTLFYTRQDEQTLRSDKVFKHKLNTDSANDTLVYFEKDDTFSVEVTKEKSKKYIVISSSSTMTTEFRTLLADQPDGEFKLFQKRVRGLEYDIAHFGEHFYVLTNKDEATNFKLMKTPELATAKENWVDLISHREDVLIEDIDIFSDFLVVTERFNGLNTIRIMPWSGEGAYYLPFESETYTAYTSTNVDFDTDILRYGFKAGYNKAKAA
jgi:oligopeptidase B